MKRDLIAVIWSLLVTGAISKWAFHVAYLERGYKAVGGEYLYLLGSHKRECVGKKTACICNQESSAPQTKD